MLNQWQYQIVHANDQYSVSLLKTLRALPSRVIVTVHGKYFKPAAIRKASSLAKAIIAVSPPVYKYAVRCGARRSKMHLIPNGVALEKFSPRGAAPFRVKYKIPSDASVIGYAGRFTSRKLPLGIRISRMLRAFQAGRPNVRVMIAGRRAKSYVKASDRCVVPGLVTKMAGFYRSCDIVVGTGRVALEAMACGKPVIAVGCGGYIGAVTVNNFKRAAKSNFGDHRDYPAKWTGARFVKDLNKALWRIKRGKVRTIGIRKRMIKRFSGRAMVRKITHLYAKTRIRSAK